VKLQTSFVLCHPLHKLEEEERVFFWCPVVIQSLQNAMDECCARLYFGCLLNATYAPDDNIIHKQRIPCLHTTYPVSDFHPAILYEIDTAHGKTTHISLLRFETFTTQTESQAKVDLPAFLTNFALYFK
jgi:hypothetical protein